MIERVAVVVSNGESYVMDYVRVDLRPLMVKFNRKPSGHWSHRAVGQMIGGGSIPDLSQLWADCAASCQDGASA